MTAASVRRWPASVPERESALMSAPIRPAIATNSRAAMPPTRDPTSVVSTTVKLLVCKGLSPIERPFDDASRLVLVT